MRICTWNVNSIRTAEAELYDLIEEEKPDIVMLQETRVKNFNLTKKLGSTLSLKATPKNHKKGGYLSGGLTTIALNHMIHKKDQHNTSKYILVTDVLIEEGNQEEYQEDEPEDSMEDFTDAVDRNRRP